MNTLTPELYNALQQLPVGSSLEELNEMLRQYEEANNLNVDDENNVANTEATEKEVQQQQTTGIGSQVGKEQEPPIEEMVITPDEQMKELNEMKLSLVEEVGYEIADPVQQTMLGIHTFTKCLAAYQETTTAYRTNEPEDLLNIIAACAYNTTLHDRLVSMEACWSAKGKPHYKTMGALYDPNANALFRTAKHDEQKRGSQFIVMPKEQELISTDSKVFVGVVDIDLKGGSNVDWDQMPVQINRIKNDINSLQYELVLKHRDEIKARSKLMHEYAPTGIDEAEFKQYAFILAVASFFDKDTFNIVLKEVQSLADNAFNGDLKMFMKKLSEMTQQYKQNGKSVISSHTIALLMEESELGPMSINRLGRYLKRMKLTPEQIKYEGIPTQGLKVETIEDKLNEMTKAA